VIISHELKFIFVHIYKTGGTSITNALQEYNKYEYNCHNFGASQIKRHIELRQYKEIGLDVNPNAWDEYFTFAFMRNPWCWLVSAYHYFQQYRRPITGIVKALTFHDFVHWFCCDTQYRNLDKPQQSYLNNMRRPLTSLITENGKVIVDFVGRYERLQSDFDDICDTIGIPRRTLGRHAASKHVHYTTYYNEETIPMVGSHFKPDIDLLGYTYAD